MPAAEDDLILLQDAAREAGELLLKDGKLSQAWMYFHTIRETEPLAAAIAAFVAPHEGGSQESEEIIELALFKGLAPAKGVEVMLRTHGTCSTITSLDQSFAQLKPEDRAKAAAILPLNGPSCRPFGPCPVAMTTPGTCGAVHKIGKPSGATGLSPTRTSCNWALANPGATRSASLSTS